MRTRRFLSASRSYWSVDVALWTSLAMAILGAALAGLNVDPDEQNDSNYEPKRIEEGRDS